MNRPTKDLDEVGIDLQKSLQRSIEKAKPLVTKQREFENETKDEYKWIREGKKLIRKKIEIENMYHQTKIK